MSEKKELELEKIRKGFKKEVITEQEEALYSTLSTLEIPPETAERIVAEFAFQTSPFEAAVFVFVAEGEGEPEEEPRMSWKGDKVKFTRFTSIREAVIDVLKNAWLDKWFKIKWISENASVYLLPGMRTDINELSKAKLLYENGIFRIKAEDKLITHLDRPLANARQEPVEF